MSRVAGSSAGFEILTTARPSPPASSSRKVWSRSLPRFRASAASSPWVTRAIAQASDVEYVGGGACRTASISAVGMAVKVPGHSDGMAPGGATPSLSGRQQVTATFTYWSIGVSVLPLRYQTCTYVVLPLKL